MKQASIPNSLFDFSFVGGKEKWFKKLNNLEPIPK